MYFPYKKCSEIQQKIYALHKKKKKKNVWLFFFLLFSVPWIWFHGLDLRDKIIWTISTSLFILSLFLYSSFFLSHSNSIYILLISYSFIIYINIYIYKDNQLRFKHLFLYTVFRGTTTLQQDKCTNIAYF